MPGTVNLTVTELMAAYRDSLLALIPIMDRCRIPWREPHVYDDWEEISAVLFRRIVVNSLAWGLPNPPRPLRVAEPGFWLDSYTDLDWIEVVFLATATEAPFVFMDFGTDQEPFDRVKARRVNPEGIPGDRVVSLPVEAVTFRLAWRQEGGLRRPIHQLRIPV